MKIKLAATEIDKHLNKSKDSLHGISNEELEYLSYALKLTRGASIEIETDLSKNSLPLMDNYGNRLDPICISELQAKNDHWGAS